MGQRSCRRDLRVPVCLFDAQGLVSDRRRVSHSIVPGVAEFDVGHTSYIPGEESAPLSREELAELISAVTADEFRSRVFEGLQGIIDDNPGRSVAVVCHGGVISTYLADVLGTNPVEYYDSDYTAITRVKASRRGRRSMISFNESHWLRDLDREARHNGRQ